jgi:cysteinyl-tRNA synthetase
LRYAVYELALHTDVDDKIFKEVEQNIGQVRKHVTGVDELIVDSYRGVG